MIDAARAISANEYLLTITLIAICVSQFMIFALLCIYISISNNITKTNMKFIELFELKLTNSNIEKIEDIDNELIKFIENIFMDYRLIHRFNNDAPVSDVEETNMYQIVIDETISKMSPVLFDRILKVYSKERIHDVIRDKTIMIVSNYCMACNTPT